MVYSRPHDYCFLVLFHCWIVVRFHCWCFSAVLSAEDQQAFLRQYQKIGQDEGHLVSYSVKFIVDSNPAFWSLSWHFTSSLTAANTELETSFDSSRASRRRDACYCFHHGLKSCSSTCDFFVSSCGSGSSFSLQQRSLSGHCLHFHLWIGFGIRKMPLWLLCASLEIHCRQELTYLLNCQRFVWFLSPTFIIITAI